MRHTHACEKLPEPVLEAETPWEREGDDRRVYEYGTVLRDADTGRFRMWYNRLRLVLYAESDDGIHWTRPNLGICDWAGATDNNIVYNGLHSPSLLYNPESANAELRYVMLGSNSGYRLLRSPDGLHWTPCADAPILTGGDTCTLAYDANTGEYLAFHKRTEAHLGQKRRLVFLSASRDLETWSEPTLVMAPDETDDAQVAREGGVNAQFYNMSVFPYGGQYLGLVTLFHLMHIAETSGPEQSKHDGPIDVQLVHSRDGRAWSRCEDRAPVIPNGPHAYDAGCVLGVANSPVIVGDEVWLYYTAITTPHGGALPAKQVSIALARWRLDGFASLDAGLETGVVETTPLDAAGQWIEVNAEISGALTVAVLDEAGTPVPGFRHEDCEVLHGDSVHHRVRWGAADHLPRGGPLRLEFRMADTRLFSHTLAD